MRQTALAIAAVLGVASSGCEKPAEKAAPAAPQAAAPNPPAENAAAPAAQPAPPPENPAKMTLQQRLETTVVDAKKAIAENPKLKVKEKNEFKAADPITYVSKAYFAGVGTVEMATLKHAVDLYYAEHEKNPTFEEFSKMMKQSNVRLQGLYRWQVYGYDAEGGSIMILEDPDKKKAEYEKAGLDPNTAP
jgi:hypothetical protein